MCVCVRLIVLLSACPLVAFAVDFVFLLVAILCKKEKKTYLPQVLPIVCGVCLDPSIGYVYPHTDIVLWCAMKTFMVVYK